MNGFSLCTTHGGSRAVPGSAGGYQVVPAVDELQQLSGNVVFAAVVRNLERVDVDAAALMLGQRSQRRDQTGNVAVTGEENPYSIGR